MAAPWAQEGLRPFWQSCGSEIWVFLSGEGGTTGQEGATSGCMSSAWIPGPPSAHMSRLAGQQVHLLWPWHPEVLLGDWIWASCSRSMKPLIFPCATVVTLDVNAETHASKTAVIPRDGDSAGSLLLCTAPAVLMQLAHQCPRNTRTSTLQKIQVLQPQAHKVLCSLSQTHFITVCRENLLLTDCAKSPKFLVCQVFPFFQEHSSIVTFNETSHDYFTILAIQQEFLSVETINYFH